jgi:hypothetical protein
MADMKMAIRIAVSFLAAATLLLIGEHIRHPRQCVDCFAPHGFPFTYGHDGGLLGGAAFYRDWLIADILALPLLAALIAWGWTWIAGRRRQRG